MPARRLATRLALAALAPTALALTAAIAPAAAAELGTTQVYQVFEIDFTGTPQMPIDDPSENVLFDVLFRHESGSPEVRINGYWDGDGLGGTSGDVFSVRFTPTLAGRWDLVEVNSNDGLLAGQRLGDHVMAVDGGRRGFYQSDQSRAGGRWFVRSDGSHRYIVGNTHYDFLGRPNGVEATTASIQTDLAETARRFNKVRFVLRSQRSENRSSLVRPFFSNNSPTDGETGQPNPQWFTERVDVAVQACVDLDLICDLIMGGTIGDQVTDQPGYYGYIAARYGSYPQVWLTLSQEWDEQVDAQHEFDIGTALRALLPYPTPVSTHALDRVWDADLNGPWHTHGIVQNLAGDLSTAADRIGVEYAAAGSAKPVVNEEVGYDPGAQSEAWVIETSLGVFLGGGYATTGNKTGSKQGPYFWGHTVLGETIEAHPSADNLYWWRFYIDLEIPFFEMTPIAGVGPFTGASGEARVLAWDDEAWVLGTDAPGSVTIEPPVGVFDVIRYDLMAMSREVIAVAASGPMAVEVPDSQAAMLLLRRSPDTDGDGIADLQDNCVTVANADQRDADADGYGSACDADLNNDGTVDFADLELFKPGFFGSDPVLDFDGSGSVDFLDLAVMKNSFFEAPGPAGNLLPAPF